MGDVGPDVRVCAVCGRALDQVVRLSTGEQLGWRHVEADRVGEDHIAVPVEPGAVPGRYRCDFCFADDPKWTLPALSFDMPAQGMKSTAHWAACEACGRLIRAGRWNALLDRIRQRMTDSGTWQRELEPRLRQLLRSVRANATGPIRRADPSVDLLGG